MSNPWKTIPLTDYEGHMSLPEIGQAQMLAYEFAGLLSRYPAGEVALIGCAGGNGFEEASSAGVARLVGIDINEQYLEEARIRFSSAFPALDLYCADIQEVLPSIEKVGFVFAALVFEYVDAAKALDNIKNICRIGAIMAVILQMPRDDAAAVSASPYTSLKNLGTIMKLIAPAELHAAAERAKFALLEERMIDIPSGKQFTLQLYRA